jgi:hypothetical protein
MKFPKLVLDTKSIEPMLRYPFFSGNSRVKLNLAQSRNGQEIMHDQKSPKT